MEEIVEEIVEEVKSTEVTKEYYNAPFVKRGVAFLIDGFVAFLPALVMYIIITGGFTGYTPAFYPAPIFGAVSMVDLPIATNDKLNIMETDQGGTTEYHNVSLYATGARALSVFVILFYVGYQAFALVVYEGKTVGKKLMGIKVIKEDGNKIDKGYLIREVGGKVLLNSTIIVPVISVITILVTPKRKAIHDMISGTRVVLDL